MARRDPPSSSGILTNVFSFVSRELGSFVTTATGGEPTTIAPKASSSRDRLDAKLHDLTRRSAKRKRKEADHGNSLQDAMHSGPTREESSTLIPDDVHNTSSSLSRNNSNPRTLSRVQSSNSRRRSKSPAMPPPPTIPEHALKRTPSVTMPGSFYPRSPSLEPDYAASLEIRQPSRSRLSHFHSYDELLNDIEDDAGPSDSPRSGKSVNSPTRSDPSPSPIRINGGPSVRGVVDRFTDDADPSLMLPNPAISPRKGVSSRREQTKSSKMKGKERDMSSWDYDFSFSGDTSGEVRVRGIERELLEAREEHYRKELEQDPDSSAYLEEREQDKQRIRALEEEVARLKRQLAEQRLNRSRMDPTPPPAPPPPPPLWQSSSLPGTVSSTRNLIGPTSTTDSFLANARAALRPTSLPVEAPINAAVYGSRTKRTAVPTFNLPTEKMAAFLTEMKSAKLKRVNSGPRQPPRRVEADPNDSSINLSMSMRRDILKDLAERDRLERSISVDSDSQVGEKRKRSVENGALPQNASSKRRALEPSFSDSSSSSFASTASVPFTSSQASSSNGTYNRSWPTVSAPGTDITTPSLCSDNENDHEGEPTAEERLLATPTREHEEPPRTQTPEIHHDDDGDEQHMHQTNGIDLAVDREPTPLPLRKAPTPVSRIEQPQPVSSSSKNAFSKRIPSSPLPSATPKKPPPPARQRARLVSQRRAEVDEADEADESDQDPLDILFSPKPRKTNGKSSSSKPAASQPGPSRIPRRAEKKDSQASKDSSRRPSRPPSSASLRNAASHQPQPVAGPSTSNHTQRRRTLDEELRRAGDRLWREADEEEEQGNELEGGVLVGLGTQKRKGFLARGGGAGVPVYMGAGYVHGAEDDEP
ncbi:unnamed protein product [Somion occarium]|uniref:Uncharacterized protein n=1 Tax=Somion occarium TaxID=3059160 RepID=A0ABP1E7B1_9APHY